MRILALDLGTKTGFAHNLEGSLYAGTWELATPKEIREFTKERWNRRQDPRVISLFDRLKIMLRHWDWPDVIVFEDVEFASSTYQVQLWSSLRAAVWCAVPQYAIRLEAVPVGTLKKFATGHGAATKEMMAAAANRDPAAWRKNLDDNAVDALHLFRWAETNLARMSKA